MDVLKKIQNDPRVIWSLPREMQEEVVAGMPVSHILELSLLLPWEERLKFIELSPHYRDIVAAYPPQELYWAIKATGPRDSVNILGVVPEETLQLFFDLEWWKKDSFVPERALSWMILLMEASKEKLLQWIEWIWHRDEALLPLLFAHFIDVVKRPDHMDIMEARDLFPPFTLDDVYYVGFKNRELQPLWGQVLAMLFSHSESRYRDLMESILWETPGAHTELAFKWRVSRLSDHGIPDYYSAIDIFAHLRGRLPRQVDKVFLGRLPHEGELPMSLVPTLYSGEAPALLKGLEVIKGTAAMERVVNEWIGVSNKVLVAEETDVDEPEQLKDALFGAAHLINLGLEALLVKEGIAYHKALESMVLEDLVRYGLTIVMEVTGPLRKMVQDPECEKDLNFLPDGLRDKCLSLLKTPPRVWDEKAFKARHFISMVDVEKAKYCVNVANDLWVVGKVFFKDCRICVSKDLINGTNIGHERGIDWATALLTLIANVLMGEGAHLVPIEGRRVTEAFSLLLKAGDSIGDVLSRLLPHGASGCSQEFFQYLKERIAYILSDWKAMGEPREFDPRMVDGLLVKVE